MSAPLMAPLPASFDDSVRKLAAFGIAIQDLTKATDGLVDAYVALPRSNLRGKDLSSRGDPAVSPGTNARRTRPLSRRLVCCRPHRNQRRPTDFRTIAEMAASNRLLSPSNRSARMLRRT